MLKRKWSLKLLLTFHVRGILHYVFEKVWLSASALHSCYSVAETFILKDNFINFIQHSTCFCKRFMGKSCEPKNLQKFLVVVWTTLQIFSLFLCRTTGSYFEICVTLCMHKDQHHMTSLRVSSPKLILLWRVHNFLLITFLYI